MQSHDIAGPRKVSEAFQRWHDANERLSAMINLMAEEPAIVLPRQAEVDPNALEEFQKFVVNSYREWFQEIVIKFYATRKGEAAYIVYARWDVNHMRPIYGEDGNVYKSLILFDADMMVTMPAPEPCLVMAKARPNELILHPIPVGFVDKVEGAALIPAGIHD